MPNWLQQIIDWSDVWVLAIPLAFSFAVKKKRTGLIMPILIYVYAALALNFLQNYFWKNKLVFSFSSVPGDNIIFYNTHSIIRFILFGLFFIQLKQPFLFRFKKAMLWAFVIIAILNFSFFQPFTKFSSRILSIEAGGLLFYCLLYYINLIIQDDDTPAKRTQEFWLVSGIAIYMVISFPIFLFYEKLSTQFKGFAVNIWDLHNFAYLLLSISMAKYFYAFRDK